MEETILEKSVFEEIPTGKIYSEKAINIGTFLGGPLVAGYLISENFRTFADYKNVKKTWIITVLSTIAIFSSIFLIPESINIPSVIFPLIYVGITAYLVKRFQEEKINEHLNNGGEEYNWWRTIGITLIGCVVTLGVLVGLGFLNEAAKGTLSESTKKYGTMNHEIVYQSNINENEADKIAEALTKGTFFDDSLTKYVYLEKTDNNYTVSISCNESVKTEPEAYQPFIELRNTVQKEFPRNKIVFNLVVENIDNVVKRIE